MSGISYVGIVAASFISLIVIACGSGSSVIVETITPSVQSEATPIPTSSTVARPDSTSSPVPESTPPSPPPTLVASPKQSSFGEAGYPIVGIDANNLTVRSCNVPIRSSGRSGFNTAPAPTAIRNVAVSDIRLGEYWMAAGHLLDQAAALVELTDRVWGTSMSSSERAALLVDLSGRWEFVCNAAGDIATPTTMESHRASVIDALQLFGSWIADSAEATKSATETKVPAGSDELEAVIETLEVLRSNLLDPEQFGIVDADLSIEFSSIDGFEVTVPFPAGWLATTGTSQLVVGNPSEVKTGLGESALKDSWLFGTAIRVRRVRNPSLITALEASEKFVFVRQSFGEPSEAVQISLAENGVPAYRSVAVDPVTHMHHVSIFTVAGSFTYIIQAVCSVALDSCPSRTNELLEQIKITGG